MIPEFYWFFFVRETVLVTAAAGGTGLAAVDIAANVFNCRVSLQCFILYVLLKPLSRIVYCKLINIGGYIIWRFLPSGHSDCYIKLTEFGDVLYEPDRGNMYLWSFNLAIFRSQPNPPT